MKTAKESNWFLVFKVRCPYCGNDVPSYEDSLICSPYGCNKQFKVSKEIKEKRAEVDKHLNKPMPPAIIRKNT